MQKKLWMVVALLLVMPGLLFVVSCQKKVAAQAQPAPAPVAATGSGSGSGPGPGACCYGSSGLYDRESFLRL